MRVDEENPQDATDGDDEAAKLFMQIAKQDSKDSKKAQFDDEQLDQGEQENDEQDTDDEPGDEQEADPWEKAPEPLRNQYQQTKQAYQKLEADHRANAGRVAALNRKLQEMQEQQDKAKKEGAKGATSDLPDAEELSGMSDEELEKEWPEVATAMRRREQKLKQQMEQELTPLKQWQQQQLEQQQQAEQQQQVQQEYSRLAQSHPDYEQVVSDPKFRAWLDSQPAALKQIAQSQNADDAAFVLTTYKGATGKTQQRQQPSRQSALRDHVTMPKKGAGRPAVDPDSADPAELFMQIAKSKG